MTTNSMTSRILRSLQAGIARLRSNSDGVAALEFAMVVPIMVVLFLGAVEFSEALSVDRRVTAIASATADLVAQNKEVTDSDLNDIVEIAVSLLGTVDSSPMMLTLASVSIDNNGNATVDWSYDKENGAPYAAGSGYDGLPSGFTQAGNGDSSVIVSDVTYQFFPKIGHFIMGTLPLSEKFYLRPRQSLKVAKKN